MKILVIGDIHGYDTFLYRLDINDLFSKYDKVVFVGDYVDSFHYSIEHQVHTLKSLVNVKEKNTNTIFLLGNHDAPYLYSAATRCDNIDPIGHTMYPSLLNKLETQIAFGVDNWLITHAGVTNWWSNYYLEKDEMKDAETLAHTLNYWLKKQNNAIIPLTELPYSRGSSNRYSKPSPLWADWNDLKNDAQVGINQIVGHTDKVNLIDDIKHPIIYETFNEDILINVDNLDKGYNLQHGLPERKDVFLEIDTKSNEHKFIYV